MKDSPFHLLSGLMAVTIVGAVIFLALYHPGPAAMPAKVTFEQKMASLQAGLPLPSQNTRPVLPRWLVAQVLCFAVVQILALVVASGKARCENLTARDVRQIEYLVETPMFLGLLGSLVGVCTMQFISGSLAAPIAYLTSINGIILYLLGRFTILTSVPVSSDIS